VTIGWSRNDDDDSIERSMDDDNDGNDDDYTIKTTLNTGNLF
jgi:hypothetical protein